MPCIFGFGTHDFCPCYLLNIDESRLSNLVCPDCEHRLRCQYKASLDKKQWEDSFDNFVAFWIDDRLHEISATYPGCCGYGLSDSEAKIINKKFEKICDENMTYG